MRVTFFELTLDKVYTLRTTSSVGKMLSYPEYLIHCVQIICKDIITSLK